MHYTLLQIISDISDIRFHPRTLGSLEGAFVGRVQWKPLLLTTELDYSFDHHDPKPTVLSFGIVGEIGDVH